MILYVDTSVIVAAFTPESRTSEVQAWFAAQTDQPCAISDWVVTEFSSALSIKLRAGTLGLPDRAAVLAEFAKFAADTFTLLPIESAQFRSAARFADQHELGLRGGDALHLAICAEHAATLCTLDRRMSRAGITLGIPSLLL